MSHLMNGEICRLATVLTRELPLEQADMAAMRHAMVCEECNKKLHRAMAIAESLDNIALVAMMTEGGGEADPEPEGEKAIIRIVVLDTRAILQQLEQASQWTFEAPLRPGRMRSAGSEEQTVQELEDFENSKTFVSYDPVKKLLAIQIDGREGKVPAAKLRTGDGSIRSISFEKRGSVYWAEVRNLEQGEYELILEK